MQGILVIFVSSVAALSCARAPPGSPDPGIVLSARVNTAAGPPLRLVATLSAHNLGVRADTMLFPAYCWLFLRAYRTPERAGPPVWDQEGIWRTRDGGCKLPTRPAVVPAGETREVYGDWVSAREILGDSLPPGRYWFAVTAYTSPPHPPFVVLPAGEVVLEP